MEPQLLEIVTRERYQALVAEAEQQRLYKMLPPPASHPNKATERVSNPRLSRWAFGKRKAFSLPD